MLNDPPSSDNDNKRATHGKDASFSIPTPIDHHEHHRMSGTLRPNLPLASNQRELLGVASNFYAYYPSHATVVIPSTATTNESSSVEKWWPAAAAKRLQLHTIIYLETKE